MDRTSAELIKALRRLGSKDAATWLLERYPVGTMGWGTAILAISHLSWKRADQTRLARHYLSTIPHASAVAYRAFASIMSIPRFLAVIEEYVPAAENDRDLLFYYLVPTLRQAARTDSDNALIASFLARYGLTWKPDGGGRLH